MAWRLKDSRLMSVCIGARKSEQLTDFLRCLESPALGPEKLGGV